MHKTIQIQPKTETKPKTSLWENLRIYKAYFFVIFLLTFCGGYYLLFPQSPFSQQTRKIINEGFWNTSNMFANTNVGVDQTNGYTTMLVMGIDSRDIEFDGQQFEGRDRNIDTIIQIVYNHRNNSITMISIPRDTGVTIQEECIDQANDRAINRIYKYANDNNCGGGGIEIMKKYTEDITGFKNNYYALISFDTFYQIFEKVGDENNGEYGLWIDIPENVYELYPVGDKFEYFNLKQGYQFLNSEELLRYARSRRNTSDFVRARRQQIVIEALKQKIFNLETLGDPAKTKGLYDSFRDNAIYSELSFDDVLGGLAMTNKLKDAPVYKIVVDDTVGGQNQYMVRPSFSPPNGVHNRYGYYLTPKDYNQACCREDNFARVRLYLQSIAKDPAVYSEQAKVAIYQNPNLTLNPDSTLAAKWIDSQPAFYQKIQVNSLPRINSEDAAIVIWDGSDGEYNQTLEYITEALKITNPKVVNRSNSNFVPTRGENIAIIILE